LGAPDLALVVANEQTAGRGRFNRRWYTPPDSALAFSLILKNTKLQDEILGGFTRLTALGALAVCDALHDLFGLEAQIKWPNDVLVDQKKLAGILVEAHWQGEQLLAAILGIGINVASESLAAPQDWLYPATCVEDCLKTNRGAILKADRLILLHDILKRLLYWRPKLASQEFLSEWEARLAFKDQWIQIWTDADEQPGEESRRFIDGKVLGLTPLGSLILCDRAGQEFVLPVGEIRFRPQERPPE
jgi:BirA family biotin operon repressor/biotin-[acetyl-CoA-carboxylase] ligase